MISRRRREANRANARASTGPKTAAGKARSARNARRHGLRLPVMHDLALATQVEALARSIAGAQAPPHILTLARAVAEAEVDLMRVRHVRHDLMSRVHDHAAVRPPAKRDERPPADAAPDLPEEDHAAAGDIVAAPGAACGSAAGLAAALSELCARLATLDRYERRAVSRRKFAVRAYDAARLDLAEG